jgi:protein SCO1
MFHLVLRLATGFFLLWPTVINATPASGTPLRWLVAGTQWIDSDSRTVSFDSLRGKPIVLTMGYTGCRKTCSTAVLVLKDIERRLKARDINAQFVMVSVDPTRDSPRIWTDYRRARDLTGDNWSFLSGSRSATKRLAQVLDVDYWDYQGHILHDFRIALFNSQGHLERTIEWARVDRLDETVAGFIDTLEKEKPRAAVADPGSDRSKSERASAVARLP